MNKNIKQHRFRSFVMRNSRMTDSQIRAYENFHEDFHIDTNQISNYEKIFNRKAPTFLEIGFGSGKSLLAAANAMPDYNFIGVETHRPGIGTLIKGIREKTLNNLRYYQGDVVDVLNAIPEKNLAGIQIFFPDPWPKRKHHLRRLIQIDFVKALMMKLKSCGTLHLATDWQDYAQHMLKVLNQMMDLKNLSDNCSFSTRSIYRPIITKFEQRALDEGREIWELQFAKR